MLPLDILKPVLIAGTLLAVMSIVDTLSYSMRTAGVLTKRLAISLALFNILVIFSRLSNMFSAPVLGNLPDKVEQGVYLESDVLAGLRFALLFVIGGVAIGALITPGIIRVFSRAIEIMERQGSLPPTIGYLLRRVHHLPRYFILPRLRHVLSNLDFRGLPLGFLVFNIFVTCFYSIGVLSTVLAASWNHDVSGTAILLSGIVNGIATLLLFLIVDPPAAVVIDGCISGSRPVSQAKAMNLYLVLTRLAGCLLALALLPPMGRYVLSAAEWVDGYFSAGKPELVAESTILRGGARFDLKTLRTPQGDLSLDLTIKNTTSATLVLSEDRPFQVQFAAAVDGNPVWQSSAEPQQVSEQPETAIAAHKSIHFRARWQPPSELLDPALDWEVLASASFAFRGEPMLISNLLYQITEAGD